RLRQAIPRPRCLDTQLPPLLVRSGSACNRVLLATANARSLPSLTCGTTGGDAVKAIGVWPATVEPIAKPALLKGICTRSRPSDRRNNSPTRCAAVPVPGEAKLYLPGWALMRATRSLTDCTGSDGLTESMSGEVTASVTGSKSL